MANILIIGPKTTVKGGISTVIKNIIDSDLATKHNFYLISTHIDGNRLVKLIVFFNALARLLFFLLRHDVDILHIHGSDIISTTRKSFYIRLSKLFNKTVIYHFHGASFLEQYTKAPKLIKRNARYVFSHADQVICLSESWKHVVKDITPASRIAVIPNAVKIPPVTKSWSTTEPALLNITFLGHIGKRKGFFDLLETVKNLHNTNIPVRLFVGGNGEVDKLRQEIGQKDLNGVVSFLGWVSENQRDELFKNTDLFVLPSYGEGMPMSILEAMAYGIPVISTTAGGIPELVVDGSTGFLIKPGDINDLENKIQILFSDKELRNRMGAAAQHRIRQFFSIDEFLNKIDRTYLNLMPR